MPLSGTGPIKMSQIKTELGSTSNSLRAYSAAAGKSAPDVMSEFFGYSSATTAAPTTAAPTTAAPTTAAPTTAAPTTAAPTTTTTTTTTLGPWTVTRLSTVSAYEACNGTADMTSISVSGGTNITNASVITFLSQTGTFESLVGNGESFWINQKVGPTFYSRRYTRTAINQGTAAESAVECDAPITEAPTTAAPTTAAPTTAAPTTVAPTTAAPTTYTVNIWGRKSGPATVLLYYGVNDTSCPDGGTTLSTTGALKHTIQVAYGGVVYVRCTNSTDDAVAFNAQIATNTYGVVTCPNPHYTAFTITENTDISVIGDARTLC